MAENQEGQEKTEEATAKRIADAREKGQVSKSQDVTTASILLIGGVIVFMLGKSMMQKFQGYLSTSLHNVAQFDFSETNISKYLISLVSFLAELLLPILLIVFVLVLASEIAQVGLKFATKKFTDPQSLSKPFKIGSGLKRIFFSPHSLIELIKGFAKLAVLGGIAYLVISSHLDEIASMSTKSFFDIPEVMSSIAFEIILKVGGLYVVIAVSDFLYQKWKFKQDMKMTKQEVKEEGKQMEGDQQTKAKIRAMGRSMIRKKMIANVPKADVIITNPTHFAVALSYKQGESTAPVVVAKGVDFLAMKIKDIANDNNIPIVEDPPLARTLFKLVEIDQEIPEVLFKAVAQVLAYIYQLKAGKFVNYKASEINETEEQ